MKFIKKLLKGILFLFIAVIALGMLASGGDKNTSSTNKVAETSTSAPAVSAPEPTKEDPSVPAEYRSALKKAETYSNSMHMSKQGIYEQLTSEYGEKFPQAAAEYAVENMTADWNYNALKKAETYARTMHMSKLGIYDQLVSEYGEQFQPEEAQYAIDNIEHDWNANALSKAKTYQSSMNMSKEAIRDQLTSSYGEKFTAEEAAYAIEHLE